MAHMLHLLFALILSYDQIAESLEAAYVESTNYVLKRDNGYNMTETLSFKECVTRCMLRTGGYCKGGVFDVNHRIPCYIIDHPSIDEGQTREIAASEPGPISFLLLSEAELPLSCTSFPDLTLKRYEGGLWTNLEKKH